MDYDCLGEEGLEEAEREVGDHVFQDQTMILHIGSDFLICLVALSSICSRCMANQLKKMFYFFCTKSMPCAEQMTF